MPRKRIDLEGHLDLILEKLDQKKPHHEICEILFQLCGIRVGISTFRAFLRANKISRPRNDEITPAIQERIRYLVFQENLNDNAVLKQLTNENISLSARKLADVRKSLKIYRRKNEKQREEVLSQVKEFISNDFSTEQYLRSMGFTYLNTELRKHGFLAPKHDAYSIYKSISPDIMHLRWQKKKILRRAFKVPGPNWIWSIDGHEKLRAYGIEIYAAIDAYSRFIPWFYIGTSATTAWNIAQQYIHLLDEKGLTPARFR